MSITEIWVSWLFGSAIVGCIVAITVKWNQINANATGIECVNKTLKEINKSLSEIKEHIAETKGYFKGLKNGKK